MSVTSTAMNRQRQAPDGFVRRAGVETGKSVRPEPRPVLFLHIPKTAGISLTTALVNRFPADKCLTGVRATDTHIEPFEDREFVAGHLDFRHVERFPRRPLVMTFLRQPVVRVLSQYYFARTWTEQDMVADSRRTTRERAQRRLHWFSKVKSLSLRDLLVQERELAYGQYSNRQTRILADAANDEMEHTRATVDERTFESALRNLESCDVVGLTERMDDSVRAIERTMGWEGLGPISRTNVTRGGRPAPEEIDPLAREILEDWNRYDERLYQFAARRLDETLQGQRTTSPASLPDASDFSVDLPIHGHGWYTRERDANGWFCWMGTSPEAWLDLRVAGEGDHRLECRIAHVIRPSILSGVEVYCNDERLRIRIEPSTGAVRNTLVARIPGRLLQTRGERVRIRFRLKETCRPCDLQPGDRDVRPLGFALGGIRMQPEPRRFRSRFLQLWAR